LIASSGERVEASELFGNRGLLVVVAFHDRAIERADDFDAFVRIRVVADDIAQADVMRHLVLFGVLEDGLKGFEVRVNVSEYGKTHGHLQGPGFVSPGC
jgi:hypothetical protein